MFNGKSPSGAGLSRPSTLIIRPVSAYRDLAGVLVAGGNRAPLALVPREQMCALDSIPGAEEDGPGRAMEPAAFDD